MHTIHYFQNLNNLEKFLEAIFYKCQEQLLPGRFRPEMLRQQIMFSMTIAERLFDNNDLLTSFCESKQKRLISTISYNFEDTRNLMNNSGAQKM